MKCPSCGYVSFDEFELCKNCGADLRQAKDKGTLLSLEPEEKAIAGSKPQDNRLREGAWRLENQDPADKVSSSEPGEAVNGGKIQNVPDKDEQALVMKPDDNIVKHAPDLDGTAGDTIFEGVFENWESIGGEEAVAEHAKSEESEKLESEKTEEEVSFEDFDIDLDEPFTSGFYQEMEEMADSEQPREPEKETTLPLKELENIEPVFWKTEPADFLRRAGAFIIDTLFILLLLMLFVCGTGVALLLRGASPAWLIGHFWIGEALLPFFILASVISGIYFIFCHWNSGGTLGKNVFSIELVNEKGQFPSLTTSFFRWMAYLVSAVPLGLGFFWPLFDHEKLSWHDRLTGTMVVVKAHESS